MQRAESPALGLGTTGSHVLLDVGMRPSARPQHNHRPSYRLFPAVESPSLPSPVPLPRAASRRVLDYAKKRSISLDESARGGAARQNVQTKLVPVNRRPHIQTSDFKPMSALQESPIDSPTVPIRYSVISKASDEYHHRVSSAPGEYIRDSQTLPSTKLAWTSKQAETHSLGSQMGLGLSMPISRLAERTAVRQGPSKTKPALTIQVKPDKPPPPPPKSPRHVRTPSVQSGVSSMHGESPSSGIVATPSSIMRAALVDAQGSPVQMPPSILHAKQGSYSSLSSDFRVREIVVTKDQISQAKTASLSATAPLTERAAIQSDNAVPSHPATTESVQTKVEVSNQTTIPHTNDDRSLDGRQFPAVPTNRYQTGAAKLAALGIGSASSASNPPKDPAASSRTNIKQPSGERRMDSQTASKPAPESAPQHGRARSRINITEQAGESMNEIRAAAKSMLDRASELAAETRAYSNASRPNHVENPALDKPALDKPKSDRPNLDKPMPNLPTNAGSFQDHIREVREAERAEKKQRTALRPFPPSYQGSRSNNTPPPSKDLSLNNNTPAADSSSPAKSSANGSKPGMAGYRSMPRSDSPSAGQTSVSHTRSPLTRDQSEGGQSAITSAAPAKLTRPPTEPQGKPASSLSNSQAIVSRDGRSPTPDIAGRPQSPPVVDPPANPNNKALPISFMRASLLMRSSTPDSVLGQSRLAEGSAADVDPIQILQDVNKQVDALHARYTQLRTDRLKLSTAISASLKDQKPGPDYANGLLDQHLSLNAISSSMDICFAKLKALDCRKEDAIAALIAQTKPPGISEEPLEVETINSIAMKPATVAAIAVEPGRSTPDIEPKTLNSTLYQVMKPSSDVVPSTGSGSPEPELNKEDTDFPSPKKPKVDDTVEPAKRVTVIRDLPDPPTDSARMELLPPVSPVSAISSLEDENKTRRFRIKGAKAAKLLGLVAESSNGKLSGPDITLPDNSSVEGMRPKKQLAIEVEIQSKFSDVMLKPQPLPSRGQVTKRKPVAAPRQGTNDSVGSITASSMSESAPEDPEVKTPRNSQEAPFGLKSAKRGMLQTIQVFVDDDILDYYRNGAER